MCKFTENLRFKHWFCNCNMVVFRSSLFCWSADMGVGGYNQTRSNSSLLEFLVRLQTYIKHKERLISSDWQTQFTTKHCIPANTHTHTNAHIPWKSRWSNNLPLTRRRSSSNRRSAFSSCSLQRPNSGSNPAALSRELHVCARRATQQNVQRQKGKQAHIKSSTLLVYAATSDLCRLLGCSSPPSALFLFSSGSE